MIESLQQTKEQMGKFCHILLMGCPQKTRQKDPGTGRVLSLCMQTAVEGKKEGDGDIKESIQDRVRKYHLLSALMECPSRRGCFRVENNLVPCTDYDPEVAPDTVLGLCTFHRWRKEMVLDYQAQKLQLR